jgi:hypothetical protein
MHELGTLVTENMAKVDVLDKERNKIRTDTSKKVSHLKYDIYRERIQKLERECEEKVQEVENQGKQTEDIKTAAIVELNKPVLQLKRILDFLRLDRSKDLTVPDDEISFGDRYKDYYKEALGYLVNDKYLKIKLFIIQNDKPTNKYSLIAVGKCLFYEDLLKLPKYYGGDFHAKTWRLELKAGLKDAPTVEQLKAWLEKHRENLFPADFNIKYLEVKTAYEQAIHDYKPDDFAEFLLARCECGNYYTVWEDYIEREKVIPCHRCDKTMTLTKKHINIGR